MKKNLKLLYFIVLISLLFIYSCPIRSVKGNSNWETDVSGNCSNIIDGDTVDVQTVGRIRLADIDAPESGEAGYQEAKNHITSLIYGKKVCLDIDDKYRTDVFDRIVAVIYVRYNSTHFLNVNKDLLDRNFAIISDYDNEFDPSEWTLYVKEIVSSSSGATDDDDDDSDDSSSNYYDSRFLVLISFGIIGGSLIVIIVNYRKNKLSKMRSLPQEDLTTPKNKPYCTQCGIKLDLDSIFCHNCGIDLLS